MLYGQYPCLLPHPLQSPADHLSSPIHPPRAEAISQAREMQVQAEGGQIPWIGHLKRPCCYGSNEGPWSYRVADPNESQGGPILPWLCELLSEVYPQLLQYHPPPLHTHLQDPAVGLGFTQAGGIRCPEEGHHLRPHPHLPFPIRSLPPQMQCLQLCNQ